MQLQKYIIQVEGNQEVREWVNTALNSYLKTNPENQGEIEHILDYLKSDRAPKRLRKMSYEQAKSNAQKWVAALKKRGNNIMELETDIETIYQFKSGARLVLLKTKSAYEREGFLMSHCVGSYFDKDVLIYSLRDAKNQPHCTIEITKGSDGSINQIKGKGNGSVHPKYIRAILTCLKKLNKSVRLSEMGNLGYTNLEDVTPGLTAFIKANSANAKFLTYQGTELFYNNSKLD